MCLKYLNELPSLAGEEKKVLFRHLARNYGRTVSPPPFLSHARPFVSQVALALRITIL